MKKHLIAAAVAAAVAVPAMAQVTVYGLLDVGYAQTESKVSGTTNNYKVTDTGATGQAAGNRLGFRGTEDLGGGLKAGFVYEIGIDPTNTNAVNNTTVTTGIFNRQSFVSLSGGFGEVAIGRFNTLTKVIQDSNTFGGPGFGIGWTTAMVGANSASAPNIIDGRTGAAANGTEALFPSLNAERISDAVQYRTPTFNGFSASIQLVNNKTDNSGTTGEIIAGKGQIVGLNYSAGPLALAVASKSIKSRSTETVESERKDDHTALLATYDFGTAKVFFVYNDASVRQQNETLKTDYEDYSIGVRVPLGNLALLAQYSDGEYKSDASPQVKTDVKGYQLGVQYSLSKRTMAYAYYGDDEAKRTGATTGERSGFVLGVRHSF